MSFARALRFLGAASIALLVSCYKTPTPACAFRCGAAGECPEGYLCGEDTQCHLRTGSELAACEPLPGPPDAAMLADSGGADIDAPESTPDAPISVPDAMVLPPDAMILPPDAMVLPPDAMVLPPDAMVLPPDAKTPDAKTADK